VNVIAPNAGTITSRSVNPGEVIEANKELMRVTDLSTVWVVGQVYEKDLATVRVGSGANVTSDAYPGKVFRGRVTYVDPKIDPATRTAQVRIEMANPRQMFKIGMYVNVAFGALGLAEKTTPTVPKDAVQTINNQQVVFVATDKATEFIMRAVRVGPENNGFYPVLEGLAVGERVVVDGSFLLRAEWMKTRVTQ
jgi:RND family efflux transporter MFP subunit